MAMPFDLELLNIKNIYYKPDTKRFIKRSRANAYKKKGYQIINNRLVKTDTSKIIEYPIDFIDREKGQSKLPSNSIKDSLRVVFKLRLRKSKRFIQMGCIGVSSSLLQMAIFNLLRLQIPSVTLATLIGIECAIINNFIFNNLITFKDKIKFPIANGNI